MDEILAKQGQAGLYNMIKAAMKETIAEDITPQLEKIGQDVEKNKFRVENLEQNLATHVEKVDSLLQSMTLRVLDQELHDRKWNLVISHLPGPKYERPDDTRKKIFDFGMDVFHADYKPYLSACHRLHPSADSKIIVRFTDLDDRDYWLTNAKKIKAFNSANNLNVSIQADLPPPLRSLQNELLLHRRDLPNDVKSKSVIKYHAHWPYVSLVKNVNGKKQITNHTVTKAKVVEIALKELE